MTVYTDLTLTSWYVDEDGEDEFVDDLGNTIIIVNLSDLIEEPPPSSGGAPLILGQICT